MDIIVGLLVLAVLSAFVGFFGSLGVRLAGKVIK